MNADHEFALEFLRKAEQDLGSARLLLRFYGYRTCESGC